MKNPLKNLIPFLTLALALVATTSTPAHAEGMTGPMLGAQTGNGTQTESRIAASSIDELWSQYESTAREIRVLARKLNTQGVVAEVNSTLKKVINETVTEKSNTSTASSAKGGLSALFFGGSASYDSSSSKSWDVTKMIVQNPEEVANFDRKEASATKDLRGKLLRYIEKNEMALIRMKELSILNLASAQALIKAGERVPHEEAMGTAAIAKELSFAGQHNVTRCVTTEFAARSSSHDDSTSASASGWLLFLSFSASASTGSKSYWEQLSHSVTECQSTTNSMTLAPDSAVYVVSFTRLDRLVNAWVEALELSYIAAPASVPFPTWSNPYYK